MADPEPSIRGCNVINAISAIKLSKAEKAREKTVSDQFNLIINVSLCFSSNLTKWHMCRSKYHGHKRGSTFLVCFDTLVDLEYFLDIEECCFDIKYTLHQEELETK
ncbi:hypothetical protein P8452_61655 [Trifolium repens]|nr:hypothetical protein P8452_61653 [Trifolium repens]WJX78430.1 hypothetical protein P8452_61655 [Trifolium repens]